MFFFYCKLVSRGKSEIIVCTRFCHFMKLLPKTSENHVKKASLKKTVDASCAVFFMHVEEGVGDQEQQVLEGRGQDRK